MIALLILGQQNEVVTALVGLALLVLQPAARHVDLAADDGLEVGHRLQGGDLVAGGRGVESELLLHRLHLVGPRFGLVVGLRIVRRILLFRGQRLQGRLEAGQITGRVALLRQQRLERRQQLLQRLDLVVLLVVLLLDVVVKLLDTEHIAVVGNGDAGLAVAHGLVHQPGDGGLSVEDRILRVNVKMYEIEHNKIFPFTKITVIFKKESAGEL